METNLDLKKRDNKEDDRKSDRRVKKRKKAGQDLQKNLGSRANGDKTG